MKKIITLVVAFAFTFCSYAQFVVSENGSTDIKTSYLPSYGLQVSNNNVGFKAGIGANAGWSYGAYGSVQKKTTSQNVGLAGFSCLKSTSPTDRGRAYGVFGEASVAQNGGLYGVFARLGNGRWGAALYATVTPSDDGNLLLGRYAGYFNGGVYISQNLDVVGQATISTLLVGSFSSNSSTLPTNIVEDDGVLDKLSAINAIAYEGNNGLISENTENSLQNVMNVSMNSCEQSRKHYSLPANQVEEMFPELVYTKENGEKLINYTELIPLLIQSIAELRGEIRALKENCSIRTLGEQINACDARKISSARNDIKFKVPNNLTEAMLVIYDANGKKVYSKALSQEEMQNTSLPVSSLQSGTYICKLISNGNVISTQKILLNNQ